MARILLNDFRGLRPRIGEKKLRAGEAVVAQNLKLGSGDLEPIPEKTTVQATHASRTPISIYLFDNAGVPIWFEWDDDVDVARGPVKDDTLERTYYSGDTTGNGAPKMTTNQLADQGGGGPYPESWLYIGVPAPATAPTLSPTELPEDKPPEERLIEDIRTDELIIDRVQWTLYPGTGTRDTVWNLNSSALGSIAFDSEPGTSFRVTEVINANRVKLESATEPGISMRTLNSDKTTVNDWHPMDNNGSTQTADFIGWRIPPGMEVKVVDHKLNVGDVIVVSALNYGVQFFAALTTDFNEVDWPTEQQVSTPDTSWYEVTDVRVDGEQFPGYGQWTLSGSFYYDVDRASSVISELEDRSYVYTYVNSFGEEGPPSPPSVVTPILDEQSVLLENLSLPPTIGYDIVKMRLYRTNSTEAGTEFQFVKEFDVSRTVRDDVPSSDLQEIISTTTWTPPPSTMKGLVALPNGMMAGFDGKQVYFCEPYFPHAWPAEYDQAVEHEIVGLSAVGNSLVVLTKGWPYVATGSHPRNMNLRAIKQNQACVSKRSIASGLDKVYYASPDGLVEIGPGTIQVVTETYMDPEDWKVYKPSTIVGEFFEGRYYGFYDFDATAVDPVIAAEVSGTITTADEADIVNGGITINLELINDKWVAAGAAFDAQRQNIIDGLDCTTNQTLGWNNQIRDIELSVTDVVRFSDTVVQITLPAASGYAITTAEIIQPVIPFSALVTSTSALPTGSTFTIPPQQFLATATMGGTIDGAGEADIVTGGETITLTLTSDTWESGAVFDAYRQELIDGLLATTNELNGWNDRVPQLIPVTNVVRTSDTVVTITLPAVPLYAVTANETITSTIPHEILVTQVDVDVVASNSVGIIATGEPSALFGGDITASVTENEIIAGGKQLTITLTNDTWIAAGTGPIGTTAQSQSIIDALVAATSQTFGWNNVVVPGVEVADLVRTSSTVATITFDPESTYSIATNETVTAIIPADVLVTSVTPLTVGNSFGITAQSPVTATLSGTVTASINEVDIRAGGKTIILTVSDDTWVASGATFDAQRQNIIDGLDAATSPTNGWNNELVGTGGSGSIDVTDVVRTSDTVVTITLPADAQYDISATETITATIPATALTISALAVVASPTFTVADDVPATVTQSGTADNDTDDDIIAGGSTIILTVANDTWVDGVDFTNVRQAIIDGLDAATTPAHGGGWNDQVRDGTLAPGNVVRTSDTVVTITLPATEDYDINAAEVITCTVPAAALTENAVDVVATPGVNISTSVTTDSRVTLCYWNNSAGGGERIITSHFNWEQFYNDETTPANDRPLGGSQKFENVSVRPSNGRIVSLYDAGNAYNAYTCDDNGETWTYRQTFNSGLGGSGAFSVLLWVDIDGGMFVAGMGETNDVDWWYSADGATWTEITTAVNAVETVVGSSSSVRSSNGGYGMILYGGDRLYIKTLVGSSVYELIPSADLTTGAVTDNWGAGIPSAITNTGGNISFGGPIGTGRGRFLNAMTPNGSSNVNLQSMDHGGSSFTDQGALPSSSGALGPTCIAYGNNRWVMLDEETKGWRIDCSGQSATYELTVGNWTRISSRIVGLSGYVIENLFYDDDYGFVLVTGNGASSVKIHTSTDGVTWTEQFAVDYETSDPVWYDTTTADSIDRINGASLD